MKKTAIEKQEKIQAILNEVQKRATARTITYEKMVDCLAEIDKNLAISKAAKKGIKADVDIQAQHFPSAYRYTPESTHFRAEYNGKTWMITEISRKATRQTANKAIILTLTDAAKQAIIEKIIENYVYMYY